MRPDGKPETLGLQILDEPAAKQSDPTGKFFLFCIFISFPNS